MAALPPSPARPLANNSRLSNSGVAPGNGGQVRPSHPPEPPPPLLTDTDTCAVFDRRPRESVTDSVYVPSLTGVSVILLELPNGTPFLVHAYVKGDTPWVTLAVRVMDVPRL